MKNITNLSTETDAMNAVQILNMKKYYGKEELALSIDQLSIPDHSFVSIVGSSGAGKSTLLRCLNGLVLPSSGTVKISGKEMVGANSRERFKRVATIFQNSPLVGNLTVFRNVLLARLGWQPVLRRWTNSFSQADKKAAFEALEKVGMVDFALKNASELSGGQKQRVAIARSLCQGANLILADEPVASLDPENAMRVLSLLKTISQTEKVTILVNLHQLDWAKNYSDLIIGLRSGEIRFQGKPELFDAAAYNLLYK